MAADSSQYFALMEAGGGVDISLGVKLGVQYRYHTARACT
jgi:acyl-CoA oxidase